MDVLLSAEAVASYEALEQRERLRVLGALERLERWPAVSGVKALQGYPGSYRVRTGDVRIVFEVRGGAPFVTRLGRRDVVYEERRAHRQSVPPRLGGG
jgi:mRNA-degrading endonuclease RelE of RelBE toxin-antitoxin system